MTNSLHDTFRILDAAANRTREGLRVIEDFSRFILNDAHLSRLLKECRHELAQVIDGLPQSGLLAARDTLGDVGTSISTPTESQRTSSTHVVQASFKRVQEALRTLEEYSKIIDPVQSARFEQLRYRLYTAEKSVIRTDTSQTRLGGQHLYLLIQADQCKTGFEAVVIAALDAGVRIFQMREKLLSDRELLVIYWR